MNKLLNEIRELNIDFPRPWNTAGARGIAPLGRRFPADCRRSYAASLSLNRSAGSRFPEAVI
jgi:hypothetical protein